MIKKALKLFFTGMITLSILAAWPGSALSDIKYPEISAPSAYVIDVSTGLVLFSRDAQRSRAVASTTKIITALLVLERADLAAEVTISEHVGHTQGATINLKPGDKHQVRDLLRAMMVASANDAAVALAEYVAGDERKFAALMNERARQIGAKNTNFINPHGLAPGRSHYSSAEDLALIAYEAMKRADFRFLVSTRRFTWETTNTLSSRVVTNTNHLLNRYPLATGIKTGYTGESGYCLVGSAEKEKRSVIVVLLGSASREESFLDTKKLLDWSLNSFENKRIVEKGRRYLTLVRRGKTVPLVADRTINKLIYNRSKDALVFKPKIKPGRGLPIKKGERLGVLRVIYMGEQVGVVGLRAERSVYSSYLIEDLNGYFRQVVKKVRSLIKVISQ